MSDEMQVDYYIRSLEAFICDVLSTLPRGPVEPTILELSQHSSGGHALPFLVVVAGMHAPLRLDATVYASASSTPVITQNGTLYAPKWASSDVLVFAADGTPLPSLSLAALGLSTHTRCAAFVDGLDGLKKATGTLLLADDNLSLSKLVAVDVASRAVRWWASLVGYCCGIAVLPAQGVAIVSDLEPHLGSLNLLAVHRLSDGTRIASANVSFVSFLVVGIRFFPTLHVISLPDRRLVYTHELQGMQIVGLAADPSGTALAVCDSSSKAIHVLPWPLPGMTTH